ncbi:hypothetical protein [Prosthecomicrobium sp. N25]|uniref:hypothetical protein n=1 Tax=Prosthecomicrobium sp. N25 TaxID=3129254 RepID=UPI0030774473
MKLAGLALAFSLAASPVLADPVGRYDVEGKSPDGSTYSGTATIERTGESFRVTWLIGKDKFVGTAVGNDDFFAVAYRSGNSTGIAAYGREGDDWIGVWTYTGGRQIGAERLSRR